MAESGISGWEVECLRCSVFPLSDMTEQVSLVWKSLTDDPPEEIRQHPQQRSASAEGVWDNGRLRLDIRAKQVDWRILPVIKDSPSALPSIGYYTECREAFVQKMLEWLKGRCPATTRMAYGAILLLRCSTLPEAYARLNELLPSVDLASENISDFSYRVNRTRQLLTGIERLRVNRISNWAALEMLNTSVQINQNVRTPPSAKVESVTPLCRLELDVNTDQEYSRELDKVHLESVFSELVQAGSEIANKGDIP